MLKRLIPFSGKKNLKFAVTMPKMKSVLFRNPISSSGGLFPLISSETTAPLPLSGVPITGGRSVSPHNTRQISLEGFLATHWAGNLLCFSEQDEAKHPNVSARWERMSYWGEGI